MTTDTNTLAHYLVARSWLDALCIEHDARPPAQTRRDLTALLAVAVEQLIDGSVTDAVTIVRQVRVTLKRWPGGTPPAAQLAVEVIEITPIYSRAA